MRNIVLISLVSTIALIQTLNSASLYSSEHNSQGSGDGEEGSADFTTPTPENDHTSSYILLPAEGSGSGEGGEEEEVTTVTEATETTTEEVHEYPQLCTGYKFDPDA